MKWFIYSFSLYILILSGVRCDVDDDCCSDAIAYTTSSPDQESPKDHRPVSPCSPFFACGVYHGVVIPEAYAIKPVVATPMAAEHGQYIEPRLKDFFPAIWQPPRQV